MDRVLAATRLHLARPLVTMGIPWLIVASSFALNAVLWGTTPVSESDSAGTGGLAALYVTVGVVYAQAVTQLLPFGMGLGLSRRSFYLGTAIAATAQAVSYAVALALLAAIEDASGGFGLGLQFWGPSPIDVDGPLLQVVVYATPLLACATVGAALGILFKRWGASALYTLAVAVVAVVIGTLLLIGELDAWSTVGGWLADRSLLTFAVSLPLAVTAIAGGLSYSGLRRVVP
ncbi:hypothetical protein OF117_21900 [Geodermatophilus sp. YIM 151500]|uniref:hypothetical protein n=1 Tax=Geodermatophilus sp. YIM 151500 TaxID=2984531 RepID=UPI0021E35DD1|nr:hypothetical protein [Geodermatophilus sp. YIM 151500]MCV2492006.1 hypothetical protein [Geodermatophilus sp. YIM 151500]